MIELLSPNTSPLPVRLTLNDYLLLGGAGAFEGYAKTEPVEGEILFVERTAPYPCPDHIAASSLGGDGIAGPVYADVGEGRGIDRHPAP